MSARSTTTTPTRPLGGLRRLLPALLAVAALAVAARPAAAFYQMVTLPSGVADDPSLVIHFPPGGPWEVAVMVRGYDNAMYAQFSTNGQTWPGWQKVGGDLRGAPACADAIYNIYCVARWADNSTRLIGWNRFTRTWSGWKNLGGISYTSPSLAPWRTTNNWGVDVFQKGTDGYLYFLHMPQLVATTPYWIKINVPTAYSPGCGNWSGETHCIVLPPGMISFHVISPLGSSGGNNVAVSKIGGTSLHRPSVATPGTAHWTRVFVRGQDGYLWSVGYKRWGLPSVYGPNNWGTWIRHNSIQLTGAPSCDWLQNTQRDFWCAYRLTNGQVRVTRWVPPSLNPISE